MGKLEAAICTMVFVACMAESDQSAAQNPPPDPAWWVTDGNVNSVVTIGNYTYVAGNFSNLGPNTGGGAKISTSSVSPDMNFPKVTGIVLAAVGDGNGGWYVGGVITKIGSLTCNNLAHILPNGNIDPLFLPVLNAGVSSMSISGNDLYIAGGFTNVNGITRNNLAKLNRITGVLDPTWNPNAFNPVGQVSDCKVIRVYGADIYVGGYFTNVGGQLRNHIAKLNNTNGNADLSWNPNASAQVYTLELNGGFIYAGGDFSNIGGLSRNGLIRLNTTTGAADATWNPAISQFGEVFSFGFNATNIFVAGAFSSIGGLMRNYLAKLDLTNGNGDPAWLPNMSSPFGQYINCISVSGNDVYVGGSIYTIGGLRRNGAAKLNSTTGAADPAWDPNTGLGYSVSAISISGTDIYLGGNFYLVGGKEKLLIARLNNSNGSLDQGWQLNVTQAEPFNNQGILSLASSGNYLYAGGSFYITVNSTTIYSLFRLDPITGNIDFTWSPGTTGDINTIVPNGNDIYVAGGFSSIGGQTRNNIARLNTTNGNADPLWNPNANSVVRSVVVNNNDIYIAGSFTNVGGQTRNRIAKVNNTNGSPDLTWNPNAANTVNVIAISGNDLYAGGDFRTIGGQTRNYIAKLSLNDGLVTAWTAPFLGDPNYPYTVQEIKVNGPQLYLGGTLNYFSVFLGMVRLESSTGNVDASWNANPGYLLNTIVITCESVFAAGKFRNVSGITQSSLARFVNPGLPAPVITSGSAISFCVGGSVTLSSNSAEGNQWYKDGIAINGATSNTLNVTITGNYSVKLLINGCPSPESNIITVTASTVPITPIISAGGLTSFCQGGNVILNSNASSGNQWYKEGVAIGGSSGNTYNATASGSYTVKVAVNGCESAASNAIAVTVNPIPPTPAITAGGAITFCQGGNVILTSNAANGNQWYKDGVSISGATATTYIANASGSYTAKVTVNGCESAASNTIVVTVNPIPPTPTISAGTATTFCTGGSVTLTSNASSGNQWYKDGVSISGSTGTTLNANASGSYTTKVTLIGCESAASNAIVVTVNPIPPTPAITAGTATTFCTGGSVTLTSNASSGNQWYKDGVSINGSTGTTLNVTASGSYTTKVTLNGCQSDVSNTIVVTVNPIPPTPTITAGTATTFCTGGSVTLTSNASSGNQWYKDGVSINGSTGTTLNVNASGSYTSKVTLSGCESPVSNAIVVTVNPIPTAPTITAGTATTFCTGGSVTLTSNASSGNQWYKDGTAISGSTGTTLNITASGSYTVKVTVSSCVSAASNAIVVTVNPIPPTPTITQSGNDLVSSAVSGNQWYLNNVVIAGATGQNYTPTTSGNYTVQVTAINCTSAFSNTFNFIITSVPNIDIFGNQVKIFPNPVNDKLVITRSNTMTGLNIRLFDINGKELKMISSGSSRIEIEMAKYAGGAYIIWIEDWKNKIRGRKIIIKQ